MLLASAYIAGLRISLQPWPYTVHDIYPELRIRRTSLKSGFIYDNGFPRP